jgi:TetR/AcrR family transcriptional regulator, cholesterol catabolism regulator
MSEPSDPRAKTILDVVVDLLESEGYDDVQVRTVARRAHVSLATIYKLFGTRDELMVSALERWADANAYAELTMPMPEETAYDTLVRVVRTVLEPWEQHPRMLEAYHRARSRPGGERLFTHGVASVLPVAEAAIAGTDPLYLSDLELIFDHVLRAVIARFADGEIAITDIRPILDRILFRLTPDELGGVCSRTASVDRNARTTTATRTAKTSTRRRSA